MQRQERKQLKTFMTGFMHFPPNCELVDFLALAGLDARREQKDAG
jgi:hypothetical protein